MSTDQAIAFEHEHCAHNYHPLPVVIHEGEGAWVTDIEGRRYLDMLSAYSAINFGHSNPVLVEAAKAQLDRITLTSRAFHNDQLGEFCAALALVDDHGKRVVVVRAVLVLEGDRLVRAHGSSCRRHTGGPPEDTLPCRGRGREAERPVPARRTAEATPSTPSGRVRGITPY